MNEGLIEKLNGIFLLAVYDKKDHRRMVYNDRFGLYPFYYYAAGDAGFVFASEAKALASVMRLEPDYAGIAEYLSLDYCLEERTFFKGVKYILPGAKIVVKRDNTVEVSTYWSFPSGSKSTRKKTKKEYTQELYKLYEKAVTLRKAGNSIIGLTGGFDSRLILGILGNCSDIKLSTYNFGTPGSGDVVGASALAKEYGTDHHYVRFDDLDFCKAARSIVYSSDGQCPFERFYVWQSAVQKSAVSEGVEVSGIGGDAVSGQKSNFTGLFPHMNEKMGPLKKKRCRQRMLQRIMRGRLAVNTSDCYGDFLKGYWHEVEKDFGKALEAAEKADTFGDYAIRLKLRTLERRVTFASAWLTGFYIKIRLPIYDYHVEDFFNQLPQKYRYGQRLYIRLIQTYYPRAAKAPHSETGRPAHEYHFLHVDFITVREFVKSLFGMKKSVYNDSFGFVNQTIRACDSLETLISPQEISKDGIFNIGPWGSVENLIKDAKEQGGCAYIMLKNIIQISLINDLFFDGAINMYCVSRKSGKYK